MIEEVDRSPQASPTNSKQNKADFRMGEQKHLWNNAEWEFLAIEFLNLEPTWQCMTPNYEQNIECK